MPSKIKDEKFKVSPVLFMTVEGEPMSFYLPPGTAKRELQPLIKSGGGMLSNVQKPGAILLIDPEVNTTIPETAAHWYVSTKYIHDCIEKNEQLNLEDYRLNPTTQTSSAKPSKERSPGLSGGRNAYTAEEDDAILSYVSKHVSEIGGNRLWQDMEKQQVTTHTWQSMKYRYRVRLAHRLSEFKEIKTAQVEKEDVPPETDPEAEQKEEESTSPKKSTETKEQENNPSETDITQISVSLDEDEQTDSQQAECPDSETCDSQETAMSEVNENPETEKQSTTTESQTAPSCEKESVPETSAADKSPELVRRPITRQQHEQDNTPYVKRLRSSSSTPEKTFKSPLIVSKTTTLQSSSKKDTGNEQPPPKKARRKTGASVPENVQEESVQSPPSQPTLTGPVSQHKEKKAEKRKLGILELATKEFEDDSEPESLDPENQDETVPRPSTSTEPDIAASSSAEPTPSTLNNEPAPIPIQAEQDLQPSTSVALSDNVNPALPVATTKDKPAVTDVTTNAHLFIFENESQEEEEEESQSLVGTLVQPTSNVHKDTAPSLTQDQLEDDIKLIKDLMSKTNQDLESVTKALLKTSGDVLAASELLLNPASNTGPFWTRTDDQCLLTSNQEVRQELQTKYGEEEVAKRIMFLAMEA